VYVKNYIKSNVGRFSETHRRQSIEYQSSKKLDRHGSKRYVLQMDDHGFTPLHLAAMAINPNPEVAKHLVDAMARQETSMNSEGQVSVLEH